ncbi:Abi-alpha family protein [Candidatus Palauibacter sp.]|uniref:Abi-alpha family protein n=1 Tax=Candidatus Palauibacter sp. TaxID=3101350 RepID=UPI003C6FB59C
MNEIGPILRPAVELINNLLGPSAREIGEIGGDFAHYWRMKNLDRIAPKVRRCYEKLGLDEKSFLRPAVGLPMLEAASYQDDSYLQDRWANLLAGTAANAGDETDFDLGSTYVEIMRQLSRTDCEILDFVAENGIEGINEDGSYAPKGFDPEELKERFDKRVAHISVEKLVTLGVLQRAMKMPITPGPTASGFAEVIVPTIIGLNFYVTASGKMPGWVPGDRVPSDAPTSNPS